MYKIVHFYITFFVHFYFQLFVHFYIDFNNLRKILKIIMDVKEEFINRETLETIVLDIMYINEGSFVQ